MAKGLISRDDSAVKQTPKQKAEMRAAKAIVAQLKGGDKADWTTFVSTVNAVDSVFNQTGNGAGKRFSGAKRHDFADQITAYANIVTHGANPMSHVADVPAEAPAQS